jgi:hypothetical protein
MNIEHSEEGVKNDMDEPKWCGESGKLHCMAASIAVTDSTVMNLMTKK